MAIGQWISNEVLLQGLADEIPSCSVGLPSGQPRSVAVATLCGRRFLFVGTSEGEVIFFSLLEACGSGDGSGDSGGGAGGLSVEGFRRVFVSLSGVDLWVIPARGDTPLHVYAQADQGVILRERRFPELAGAADGCFLGFCQNMSIERCK